jgi:hypothetical protein
VKARTLALACAVLIANTAHSQTFADLFTPTPVSIALTAGRWLMQDSRRMYQIDVESSGATFDAAKHQGFRLAVEQAVGSLITSEAESRNGAMVRQETISYSSGYVDRFEIQDRTETRDRVTVRMRVWVSHSAIADRLLYQSRTATSIDGARAAAAAATVLEERKTGDRLATTVLQDFPSRAFDVSADSVRVTLDANRQVQLQVPYRLKWNYSYVSGLGESLMATAQQQDAGTCDRAPGNTACASASYVRVISGRPPADSGRWFGWSRTLGYSDSARVDQIRLAVASARPQVLITVLDNGGRILYKQCRSHPELDHLITTQTPDRYFAEFAQFPARATINGDLVIRAEQSINIGANPGFLENMYRVELQVVRQSQC